MNSHWSRFAQATLALILTLGFTSLNAQVIYTTPSLPTVDDAVTVFFDASEGNGELAGFSGTVYAHTGVILTTSTGPGDWQNVQGSWGTADADVEMTSLGGDLYSITYTSINDFYGLASTDTVLQLAFVFRNADGSMVGRAADGSDIYTNVALPGLSIAILDPSEDPLVVLSGTPVPIEVAANESDEIKVYYDGGLIGQTTTPTLSTSVTPTTFGSHEIRAVAYAGSGPDSAVVTSEIFVRPPVPVAPLPAGVTDGLNEIDDSTVTIVLFAPEKDYVFLMADWNDWSIGDDNYMNVTPDGDRYWLTVDGLTPMEWYSYQFLIDGDLRVADYYSHLVLDPWNDEFINEATWPGLPDYPHGLTTEPVSLFRTAEPAFNWTVNDFEKPAKGELVVYELLMRDFIAAHNYTTLLDTLDYLERLGVNAIELMPVMEFENNNSWGYNTSFHGALDKYYGTPEQLKTVIDECHSRGIAVILDMVFNHAFGQSPMVRMYWDGSRPAVNSPWFNQEATHDFNVGFDYNHESPHTRQYVKDILERWVAEYRFDGYRMDLTKGFTQNVGGDFGAGGYDATRIAILKDYADHVWSVDPDAYFICEHFAENSEEKELAEYGMMLWGNLNHPYRDGIMGWVNSSDVTWGLYTDRGWNVPHVITYMESHDEERIGYSNTTWGNQTNPDHDVRDLTTSLLRHEAGAAIFLAQPGAKMIWQFGELGYDFSIDYNGRTGPKPIRWDYREENGRKRLYQIYSAMNNLRNNYPVFHTNDFDRALVSGTKRMNLHSSGMEVTVLANFDVVEKQMTPYWDHTGTWYDYFNGTSIEVTNTTAPFTLSPGEYHVFTDMELETPDIVSGVEDVPGPLGFSEVWPNPSSGPFVVQYELGHTAEVRWSVYDAVGKLIESQDMGTVLAGVNGIAWTAPEAGFYLMVIESEGERITHRLVATR